MNKKQTIKSCLAWAIVNKVENKINVCDIYSALNIKEVKLGKYEKAVRVIIMEVTNTKIDEEDKPTSKRKNTSKRSK